ncbi:MAG: HlyD family efflux transporter periplasmic adaptor subunit [Planctomycetota bacterium]
MSRLRSLLLNRRLLIIPPILIGIGVLAVLASSKRELKRVEIEEYALPVRVVRVEATEVAASATGYGTVVPNRVWVAVAEVGGRVESTFQPLKSGIFVPRGERLVKVDDQDYQLRLKQRLAEQQQAESELERIQLNQESDQQSLKIQTDLLAVRRSEVQRLERLQDLSATSQNEQDRARASLLTQQQSVQTLKASLSLYAAQVSAARASVQSAIARTEEAQRDVGRTVIAAPFSGLLADVQLDPGQYVSPRQQLFELHDLSSVEVEAQFSLAQILRLVPDSVLSDDKEVPSLIEAQQVLTDRLAANAITRSGDVSLSYAATPIRISGDVDPQTRTVGVVVRVTNPRYANSNSSRQSQMSATESKLPLRPGSFCEVKLQSQRRVRAVLVQRTAVNDQAVWIVDQDNRMRKRLIAVQSMTGRTAAVVGINEGELVVVNPPRSAREGQLTQPLRSQSNGQGDSLTVAPLEPGTTLTSAAHSAVENESEGKP